MQSYRCKLKRIYLSLLLSILDHSQLQSVLFIPSRSVFQKCLMTLEINEKDDIGKGSSETKSA